MWWLNFIKNILKSKHIRLVWIFNVGLKLNIEYLDLDLEQSICQSLKLIFETKWVLDVHDSGIKASLSRGQVY